MKLYSKCGICGKKKLFIRIRKFFHKLSNAHLTSELEICTKCFNQIKNETR